MLNKIHQLCIERYSKNVRQKKLSQYDAVRCLNILLNRTMGDQLQQVDTGSGNGNRVLSSAAKNHHVVQDMPLHEDCHSEDILFPKDQKKVGGLDSRPSDLDLQRSMEYTDSPQYHMGTD